MIRPGLNHRSDRIRAGEGPPRPRAHFLHIAAEAVKVLALLALGVSTPKPRGRP
ncbi:hypothetical protein QNO09_25720 [Streptomyces sp. 378]|uniref:hypothetical protein n=1 Tax=Streptomyces sp. 378 TaxID=3049412 RepID=UPI0024C38BCB|nr:hypothetical protein [Streptomyces sp. 378]MDK1346645.1 hypothetical protein [Streptomyces sp. 378]